MSQKFRTIAAILGLILILGGFGITRSCAESTSDFEVNHALRFEQDRLSIQTKTGQSYDFSVELAVTRKQQAQGLMAREFMAADAGMLFWFDDVRPRSFWMKNTLIPLDIIHIKEDGTIGHIHHNARPLDTTSKKSDVPTKAVLEINGGLSKALDIQLGDQVLYKGFGE